MTGCRRLAGGGVSSARLGAGDVRERPPPGESELARALLCIPAMILYRCFLHAAVEGAILALGATLLLLTPSALPDQAEPVCAGPAVEFRDGEPCLAEATIQEERAEAVLVDVRMRDFADFDTEARGEFAMMLGQTQHLGAEQAGHDVWVDVEVRRAEDDPRLYVVALSYRRDGVVEPAPTLLVAPGEPARVEFTTEHTRRSFAVEVEPVHGPTTEPTTANGD